MSADATSERVPVMKSLSLCLSTTGKNLYGETTAVASTEPRPVTSRGTTRAPRVVSSTTWSRAFRLRLVCGCADTASAQVSPGCKTLPLQALDSSVNEDISSPTMAAAPRLTDRVPLALMMISRGLLAVPVSRLPKSTLQGRAEAAL